MLDLTIQAALVAFFMYIFNCIVNIFYALWQIKQECKSKNANVSQVNREKNYNIPRRKPRLFCF